MSKKIALSTNTSKLFLTSSSPENHSPPPSAEIIASNVDLLAEILLLVPARQLIKFKSVSKRWLSLISDSRFARNHTLQNPSPLPSGLYFYTQPYGSYNDQITRVSIHDDPRTSLPNLPFHQDSGSRTRVLHSSNGLMLCSTFDSYNYVICNLITQKFAVLPGPVVYISYCNKFGSYLVFDPKRSPYYKVVVVSFAYDLNSSQLDVYSSESASWKSPILAPKIQYQRTGVHGAVWNGELILMSCVCGPNWESCAKHDHLYIRFDIDAEKLTTNRVPYLDSNLTHEILYFGECTDHLLLIQRSWNDPMELEVLEMMVGENYFRWNVKYVVDLTRFRLRSRSCGTFLVMSVMNVGANENDLAVVLYIWGKVIQYNIDCKTLKVLCDFPKGDFCAVIRALYEYSFRFIESLTPV